MAERLRSVLGGLALGLCGLTAMAEPAWRPAERTDLQDLIRCEAVIEAEIARRGARLDRTGDWTVLHQALWRLEAERALLEQALRAVMDRHSADAARETLLPGGTAAMAPETRRRTVRDCASLVERVHAAGDAQGHAYADLPRVAFPGVAVISPHATR